MLGGAKMIAYCGLNCLECDAYIATQKNSDKKREKTAQKWSKLFKEAKMYQVDIKPEQICCDGCKSNGARFFHCEMCKIRECCLAKGIENCAACKDYICETLAEFIKLAPEAGNTLAQLRTKKM